MDPPVERIATVGSAGSCTILARTGTGVWYSCKTVRFLIFLLSIPMLYPVLSLRTVMSEERSAGRGSNVPSKVPSLVVNLTLSPGFIEQRERELFKRFA